MTSFSRSFQLLSPWGTVSTRGIIEGQNRRETYLAARRLGEPQSPLVLERVLDVEVILVVEDGDVLAVILDVVDIGLAALWGDGDRGQIDLLVHVVGGGHGLIAFLVASSHEEKEGAGMSDVQRRGAAQTAEVGWMSEGVGGRLRSAAKKEIVRLLLSLVPESNRQKCDFAPGKSQSSRSGK